MNPDLLAATVVATAAVGMLRSAPAFGRAVARLFDRRRPTL